MQDNLCVVLSLYGHGGLNIIPIKTDGSKKPRIRWSDYQTTLFPEHRLAEWFGVPGNPSGIGIICGSISRHLEVLDFDCYRVWPLWCERQTSLLSTLPIVQTPDNGRHVYFRCPEISGNSVLARNKDGEVLIETRGQGGYVIAPGSPKATHPTGRPYSLVQGDLRHIPTITPEQRNAMLDTAREFNEYVSPPKIDRKLIQELYGVADDDLSGDDLRPGDDFNARAEWADVLEPHGWSVLTVRNCVSYWRKPGSFGSVHHATTNYDHKDQLVVYSTAIKGFEATVAGLPAIPYSKFAAYAILNCDGDFVEAAQQLRQQGYGSNEE